VILNYRHTKIQKTASWHVKFLAYLEHVTATSATILLVATSKENLQTIIWSFTLLHKTSTSEITLAIVLFQHYLNSGLDDTSHL
jgi:hypothetical protein